MRRLTTATLAVLLIQAVLRAPAQGQDLSGSAAGIDEVVEWLDPLVLEEIDAALNARPRLAIDPIGGFIVTDEQESQVRVYGPQGQLLTYFGREGEGPRGVPQSADRRTSPGSWLHGSTGLVRILRQESTDAFFTQPITEHGLGATADVLFDLMPVPLTVFHFLATGADRQ